MHNGERRNPLAGVAWNKYMPFVLVTRVGSRARLPPARGSERNASPTGWEGWEGWLKVLVSARNFSREKAAANEPVARTNDASWTEYSDGVFKYGLCGERHDSFPSKRSTILSAWTYSTPIFVPYVYRVSHWPTFLIDRVSRVFDVFVFNPLPSWEFSPHSLSRCHEVVSRRVKYIVEKRIKQEILGFGVERAARVMLIFN